ncbi:MAG: hypothetical protein FRX48_04332 [Lasallia pustulata]|uniref:Uncharacterized protein n=1 Tax=Lasallia pustulata TaxID=136370 RepID=A0A5M8PT65_9LECA|nr:MAG: hypothetical protein FRX48_04332 [Lasallia pustulata]
MAMTKPSSRHLTKPPYFEYEKHKTYTSANDSSHSPYSGKSSIEQDLAWLHMLEPLLIRASRSELLLSKATQTVGAPTTENRPHFLEHRYNWDLNPGPSQHHVTPMMENRLHFLEHRCNWDSNPGSSQHVA